MGGPLIDGLDHRFAIVRNFDKDLFLQARGDLRHIQRILRNHPVHHGKHLVCRETQIIEYFQSLVRSIDRRQFRSQYQQDNISPLQNCQSGIRKMITGIDNQIRSQRLYSRPNQVHGVGTDQLRFFNSYCSWHQPDPGFVFQQHISQNTFIDRFLSPVGQGRNRRNRFQIHHQRALADPHCHIPQASLDAPQL